MSPAKWRPFCLGFVSVDQRHYSNWSARFRQIAVLVGLINNAFTHAPGMPGTFSPLRTSKETARYWSRHASRHVRQACAVMHVGITNPRWRGTRSRHSQHMRNPKFFESGKRPIGWAHTQNDSCLHMPMYTLFTLAIARKCSNERKTIFETMHLNSLPSANNETNSKALFRKFTETCLLIMRISIFLCVSCSYSTAKDYRSGLSRCFPCWMYGLLQAICRFQRCTSEKQARF